MNVSSSSITSMMYILYTHSHIYIHTHIPTHNHTHNRAQRIDEDDTKPFFGQSLSNEDDVFAKPWDIKPIRSLHLAKPQSSKVGEAVGSSVKETSQSDTDATFAHKTRKLTKIEIDSSQAKEVREYCYIYIYLYNLYTHKVIVSISS